MDSHDDVEDVYTYKRYYESVIHMAKTFIKVSYLMNLLRIYFYPLICVGMQFGSEGCIPVSNPAWVVTKLLEIGDI